MKGLSVGGPVLRVVSGLLVAILAVPPALVAIRWAFGAPPRPSLLVILLVAYGIGLSIFVLPGIRFVKAAMTAARARRDHPRASVYVIRDFAMDVPTLFGPAPLTADSGVLVVSPGRLAVLSKSGADREILTALTPDVSIELADAPTGPLSPFIARPAIQVQANGIDARFSLVSPNMLNGFGYSRTRTAELVRGMNLAVTPSV